MHPLMKTNKHLMVALPRYPGYLHVHDLHDLSSNTTKRNIKAGMRSGRATEIAPDIDLFKIQ